MRIITLSREFGSGGREIGKRLADALGFVYYDSEIITAIAQQSNLDEAYVQRILEGGVQRSFPITFGRTFSYRNQQAATNLLLVQQKILKELSAKSDCIIVGRGADVILEHCKPFNLFVYADMDAKIKRCGEYADEKEHLTEKELQTKIRHIDQQRRQYYELCTGNQWGEKTNYHLCINTTELTIKEIIPSVAEYAKTWLERGKNEDTVI